MLPFIIYNKTYQTMYTDCKVTSQILILWGYFVVFAMMRKCVNTQPFDTYCQTAFKVYIKSVPSRSLSICCILFLLLSILLIWWKKCILVLICISLITSEVEKSCLAICILLVNSLLCSLHVFLLPHLIFLWFMRVLNLLGIELPGKNLISFKQWELLVEDKTLRNTMTFFLDWIWSS